MLKHLVYLFLFALVDKTLCHTTVRTSRGQGGTEEVSGPPLPFSSGVLPPTPHIGEVTPHGTGISFH